MDFKTFLENFDAIAEAPGGIQKLRSLILDLAVRGKLVTQDFNDESATALLEKINEVKQQIAKQIKVKRMKSATSIPIEEKNLSLPSNWECVYLEGLIHPEYPISYGVLVPGADVEDGVPLVRVQDLDLFNPPPKPSKSIAYEVDKKYARTQLIGEEILMAVVGSIGKLAIAPKSWAGANIARAVCRISPVNLIDRYYLTLVLQANLTQKYFLEATRTLAQPTLNIGLVEKAQIPLPPLAEQKRIVEKVDELMALCDRYEAAKQTRDNLRQQLRGSAINSLMNAETDEELDAAWEFVRNNWQKLNKNSKDVNNLRQAILQLAVRGKLVPQNPGDEPASELITRIKNEFKELINQKKIREAKLLPVLKDDELPFDKPIGWEWCRLGEILRVSSGDNLTSHEMADSGKIPVFGGNGITGYHDKANVHKQTLVIGRVGFYCGSVHITPKLAWVTDNAFITTFSDNCIYIHFFYWLLKAINLQQNNSATAQPVISGGKIYSIPVSLPPLAEQKRIVAKVDELMQLCDQLEASLCQSQQRAESLAASAISHLTI